jgi:hypothetical protein
MAQAVSRRTITAEARVRSQGSQRGIYGGQYCTGAGVFPTCSFLIAIPPMFHI